MPPKSKSKSKRRESADGASPSSALPLSNGESCGSPAVGGYRSGTVAVTGGVLEHEVPLQAGAGGNLLGDSFPVDLSLADTWTTKDASSNSQIWLSPSTMNVNNVAAGDLVAVGVLENATSSAAAISEGIASLPGLLSITFRVVPPDATAIPGVSFLIAAAWPSPRVPKGGARLSWQLSDSLARPPLGTRLRIHPLKVTNPKRHASRSIPSTSTLSMPQSPAQQASPVGLPGVARGMSAAAGRAVAEKLECSHLSLMWCPPLEEGLQDLPNMSTPPPPSPLPAVSPRGRSRTGPKQEAAPPRTPVQSESPYRTPPKGAGLQTREVMTPGQGDRYAATPGKPAVAMGRNEGVDRWQAVRAILHSGATGQKSLVEKFAGRFLEGRVLLAGNLVTIPICGRDCVFQVEAGPELHTELRGRDDTCTKLGAADSALWEETSGLRLQSHEHSPGGSGFDSHDVALLQQCQVSASSSPDDFQSRGGSSVPLGSESMPLVMHQVNYTTEVSLNLPQPSFPSRTGGSLGDVTTGGNPSSDRAEASGRVPDAGNEAGSQAIAKALEVGDLTAVKFSALGGLGMQISALREMVELPLHSPELFARYGIKAPRGVLLHGPPGTGKTSLARAAAAESGASMFVINGPEIVSEFFGESEQALKAVFSAAQKAAPSVVFIDEVDAIAPARGGDSEDIAQRMVAALLTILDGGGAGMDRVIVIAATNRIESIDPALRRPGRFDRELEIGVPTPAGRLEILQAILKGMRHTLDEAQVRLLAASTHGFVGADLAALCSEAALTALRRIVTTWHAPSASKLAGAPVPNKGDHQGQTREEDEDEEVRQVQEGVKVLQIRTDEAHVEAGKAGGSREVATGMGDFEEARKRIGPSAMREVAVEVPRVNWSDIGGNEAVKQRLQEAVEWPQKHGEAFARVGAKPPRGVLLYGPPGCSKTLMARAVATEAGLNFLAVKGPELLSKYVGESEKAVRTLFARARQSAPSIVFFDEIDGLAGIRGDGPGGSGGAHVAERVLSQLLTELDGLAPLCGVAVVAATNRPDLIDPALLRPGRFDRLLLVGPPNEDARNQIFAIQLRSTPLANDVSLHQLAAQTEGHTGADISSICREAAMAALEEDMEAESVHMRHFQLALQLVPKSQSDKSKEFYEKFERGGGTR